MHVQRGRAWSAALAVAGVVASLAVHSEAEKSPVGDVDRGYTLTAAQTPAQTPATVLTLEPGLVGIQNVFHVTPRELQGYFCAAPNTCRPVDYLTLPGNNFNERGADKLLDAVRTLPAGGGPVILMGHSQGAQVIYSALRRWAADPSTAPDPARVSWVSIGNPDNPIGGIRNSFGDVQPRPAETPYAGTEVIRQYDGWADWPDNPGNLLAVANALAGMAIVHPNYFDVDINDPANVRYTPDLADGSPGNVTYVWVPNPTLPLVAGLGPLGTVLDPLIRPMVEAAYDRPVPIPAPDAKPAAVKAFPRSASTTVATDGVVGVDDVALPEGQAAPPAPKDAAVKRSRGVQLTNSRRGGGERRPAAAAQPRAKSAAGTAAPRRSK